MAKCNQLTPLPVKGLNDYIWCIFIRHSEPVERPPVPRSVKLNTRPHSCIWGASNSLAPALLRNVNIWCHCLKGLSLEATKSAAFQFSHSTLSHLRLFLLYSQNKRLYDSLHCTVIYCIIIERSELEGQCFVGLSSPCIVKPQLQTSRRLARQQQHRHCTSNDITAHSQTPLTGTTCTASRQASHQPTFPAGIGYTANCIYEFANDL